MSESHPSFPSRRTVVGGLTAGLGGLMAASAESAQGGALPMTPTGRPEPRLETKPTGPEAEKLGWAVVGLGDFAQGYALPALARASLSRPAALVSGNRDKLQTVGARYAITEDGFYAYDTMAKMSDNADIEAVYIVTPNSTHAELTVRALEAGKHVLCEKPMANSPSECQRMIDAAKAANRKLMIAYRVHWEPHSLRAKAMIDKGDLGDVWFAASDHHRPLDPSLPRDEWRAKKAIAGGGSLVDIGIYSLNGLQWLLGESPDRVAATMFSPPGDPRFAEVECTFTAQLVFPSGRRANISSGYDATKKRADLFGSKATIVLDPATEYEGNRLSVFSDRGVEEVRTAQGSEVQFTGEIDHFSQAIRGNGEIRTPGEMGLRDIRLIAALYKAAETGQWVDLNPDMTVKNA
ncbi:MAG: Gfo/Idh/MocA family oxidoreductase [Methylobacterium mesophilicum]|nr:Gfo/Idh/MocA family oxidoreductase [Methylobacterium mesophilicum]